MSADQTSREAGEGNGGAGKRQPLPGVLSQKERRRFNRCLACGWHPPTQGHDPLCPR